MELDQVLNARRPEERRWNVQSLDELFLHHSTISAAAFQSRSRSTAPLGPRAETRNPITFILIFACLAMCPGFARDHRALLAPREHGLVSPGTSAARSVRAAKEIPM